jgi:uncharacterized repeat protein (TIGR02543 family)
MSKRIFSVIFIAIFASAFCLGLAACGGANSEKNIKLTFIVDGVVYHSVEINGDEEIALPDNPVKGGHVFKGWFFDKDTWNNQYTGGMQITEDTTLYAKFEPAGEAQPQEYTITFNTNGGSAVASITKQEGESVTAPAPPEREGYIFDGWYSDDGTFAVPYTFGVMPAQNITVYAKWKPVYRRTDYNGNPDVNGDYIFFGEYPQTIKADDVTITSTTDGRGYYLGSDGFYYAKLTAAPDNPLTTKFSNNQSISEGEEYYFKAEPIKWRILSENEGKALILCEIILRSMEFDAAGNNYKESKIREWLNDHFYNTAFNASAKSLIVLTTLDNSAQSTGYNPNDYACENTNDNIFLLSYKDVTNTDYGFIKYNTTDSMRKIKATDFSKASGTYIDDYGFGWWWLRSPDYDDSDRARMVDQMGRSDLNREVSDTRPGVVPALYITLETIK